MRRHRLLTTALLAILLFPHCSKVSPSATTITATPASLLAGSGGTSTIVVETKDAKGNRIAEGGASVTLAATLGTLTPVTDNHDGTYTAKLLGDVAGSAKITGTLNGKPIANGATVVFRPKRAIDFSADGRGDVFWRNTKTGENSIWFMDAKSAQHFAGVRTTIVEDTRFDPVAFGDFDGDGASDSFWWNRATGETFLWLMNRDALRSAARTERIADTNWKPAGAGDFDGDGKTDVFWFNTATGETSIWFLSGAQVTPSRSTTVPPPWSPAVLGDFNGDAISDVLWHNASTGETSLWFMHGAKPDAVRARVTALEPAGCGDFNGDAISDVLWRDARTGHVEIWLMGKETTPITLPDRDAQWKAVAFGDFDGDHRDDLFWWNPATGVTAVSLMQKDTAQPADVLVYQFSEPHWKPIPAS